MGVFVSCSTGNSGPAKASLANVAPWIMTVGAGTLDRDFPSPLTRVEKGQVVKEAGGIGMILGKTSESGEELVADSHLLPAVAVGKKFGRRRDGFGC